jgi:hypothetical protein
MKTFEFCLLLFSQTSFWHSKICLNLFSFDFKHRIQNLYLFCLLKCLNDFEIFQYQQYQIMELNLMLFRNIILLLRLLQLYFELSYRIDVFEYLFYLIFLKYSNSMNYLFRSTCRQFNYSLKHFIH